MSRIYSKEVTVQCERNEDGTWFGTVCEDAIQDALDGVDVSATVEDDGVGAYEYCGQCGVHHDWTVTAVEGEADVDFNLDFQGYEFESDEEQEEAENQVWATLEMPTVSGSGTEEDIDYDFTWYPDNAAGPSVTYKAEM